MRLALFSDLHLEGQARFEVPKNVRELADIVVLAGDIAQGKNAVYAADALFPWCPVLLVPGNHEYYHGLLGPEGILDEMRAAEGETGHHVRVLDRDEVCLEGVRFLGATGWSDFQGADPLASWKAQQGMNDYRMIRIADPVTGTLRKITTRDVEEEAVRDKAWLVDRLAEQVPLPTVVITHHAPSPLSQKGSPWEDSGLTAAFSNNWEHLVYPRNSDARTPKLWLHGHTHWPADYRLYKTRVLSNPRGYGKEATGFDPGLLVELQQAD